MDASITYSFESYRLVPAQRLLLSGGFPVKLGGRAYDMLVALVERRDRTVPKQELVDLVWPRLVVEQNNLQVQIGTLRKLLGHGAIATVPGRGYRFTMAVKVSGTVADRAASVSDDTGLATVANTNLPPWSPPLLGRDAALSALLEDLDQHAWVTVAGTAGVGKTRLAQAAARALLQKMPAGVWWVDLAPLTEPEAVAHAVALAMNLPLKGAVDPVEAIARALDAAPSLLVLDNSEHLLEGVSRFLTRLRPATQELHLLITSQEIVHGPDEHVFRLDPLSLPEDDSLDSALDSGSAALFAARAQACDRQFTLGEGNCATVADICRRLDGIPLAIELAAARIPLLGVEGLRARLDKRFEVLTSPDRTSQRRHRTLRDALEWSHQLLSTPERTVFRRLGVFAGSFTLEAAQAVAEDELGLDRWEVLENLGTLVDKSLVVAEGQPIPRYRLLESMRLFALERLMEHAEVEAARSAHRDHFLFVVEAAQEAILAGRPEGLALLDLERENLFLALAWRRGDDDGLKGLRLARAMHRYWTSRGLVTSGLQSLRAALNHPGIRGASQPRLRAELAAALFSALAGETDEAVAHAIRATGYARELHDEDGLGTALARLGMMLLRRGDLVDADRCAQEALAIARKSSRPESLCMPLELVSSIEAGRGNLLQAREAEEEILAVTRTTHDLRNLLIAHLNLASTNLRLADQAGAREHVLQALQLLSTVDSEFHGAYILRVSASLAALGQRHEEAVQLHAAYETQGLRIGVGESMQTDELERLTRARDALPDTRRMLADQSARQWNYDEALRFAASAIQAIGPPASEDRRTPTHA